MIDPSLVSKFMRILSGKKLSSAEATQLAERLGTREEFLAHLIVKTDFPNLHKDVREALQAAANESGYEASTKREIDGPLAASRGTMSDLSSTLLSIMETEKTSITSYAKLADIEQQMVRFAVANGNDEASPERWIKTPRPAPDA